jgi:DNA-directed RNA polymerase specialized sigma24 family protein
MTSDHKSSGPVPSTQTLREERALTSLAFTRLLEWLDDGVDSQGERYLEMRRRLIWYFDRRNRHSPEELADETLNRVARTLEESGVITITPPARYCYVVARFVLLEDLRKREHTHLRLDDPRSSEQHLALDVRARPREREDETAALQEKRLGCLEKCLQKLKPEQRDLILEYYRDARREKIDRRREMAKRLGISMNALAIRACRIRDVLEECVSTCCKEP